MSDLRDDIINISNIYFGDICLNEEEMENIENSLNGVYESLLEDEDDDVDVESLFNELFSDYCKEAIEETLRERNV